MNQFKVLFTAAVTVVLLLGCSSSRNPVSLPVDGGSVNQLTGNVTQTEAGGAWLWGYYELYFDAENKTIEATPIRSVEFTANVVKFLNNDPQGLKIKFNGSTVNANYVDVDLDVTIKHPLSQHQYDGYDVRGVFIGNGAQELTYNTDLLYAEEGTDQILLNADGYTRWYNPTEFLVPNMFGYVPGKLASSGYTGTATLNPYKYFGDGLGNNENLWGYLNSGDPQTGYFLAGTSNTRNYKIRFPIPQPGAKYGYAVIANWAGPDPQDHPSHAPEAVGIAVEDNSDLFYVDSSTKGGNLKLDIKVFDWDAAVTSGVMEDYAVWLESNVLGSDYQVDMTPTASADHWCTYHVEIPADQIEGIEGNEMWVAVEDSVADYTNPLGVENAADTDKIAACFRYPLTVSSEEPMWIHVTSPNGGEQWKVGGSEEITWDANPDISSVAIILSLNSGEDYTEVVSLPTPNDGSFIWDPIPAFATGTGNRIRILDVGDFDVYDSSDADFAVTSPFITVLTPDGGEQWKTGTPNDITWNADPDIQDVMIELSLNSGVDYILVIAPTTPNTLVFAWDPVPFGIDSDTCRIKISDIDCPEVFDESSSDFEIFEPWINVTSPNGGEELEGYMSWEITWESSENGGTVYIEYSKDNFVDDINPVAANTPNDGSYIWEDIPFDLSDTVRIRIFSASPSMSDTSDGDFSIVEPAPFIRVLTPNGGEQWGCGSSKEITWWSFNVTGNVDIYYSKDNFVSDNNLIAEDIPVGDSYKWSVPADISDTIRVKVIPVDYPSGFDVSDNDFSIVDGGWASTWGDDRMESLIGVVSDATGDSYATGDMCNSSMEYSLALLRKYDPAGELVWSLTWGDEAGGSYCYGKDIALDDLGYLYVTGYFRGEVDFDPSTGSDLHASYNGSTFDIFISKFDSDGTWYWTKTWGGSGNDQGKAVAVWQSSVCVAGEFQGTDVDFDPDPSSEALYTSNGGRDAFISWFDTSGNFDSARTWGGAEDDRVFGVAVDDAGTVFATGTFRGSDVNFDQEYGSILKSSNGSDDAFLCWFENWDNLLGVETWGGIESDIGYSVSVDGLGNTYVAGYFSGTDVDFDPGDGIDLRSSVSGSTDAFLSKFDSSVSYQWARTWGGTGTDYSYNVCVDGLGNVFAVGTFYSSDMDFDPGSGSDMRSSNGWDDAYYTMFDSSGNYVMARKWGGTSYDEAYGLSVSDTGAIFVSGFYYSSPMEFAPVDAPCFEDSDIHSNGGGDDAFLVKYLPDGCW
jgi:hypothetical protein